MTTGYHQSHQRGPAPARREGAQHEPAGFWLAGRGGTQAIPAVVAEPALSQPQDARRAPSQVYAWHVTTGEFPGVRILGG